MDIEHPGVSCEAIFFEGLRLLCQNVEKMSVFLCVSVGVFCFFLDTLDISVKFEGKHCPVGKLVKEKKEEAVENFPVMTFHSAFHIF